MEKTIQLPTPPWDMDVAAKRLKFEEEAWNSRDPERISEGYADNNRFAFEPVIKIS